MLFSVFWVRSEKVFFPRVSNIRTSFSKREEQMEMLSTNLIFLH